MQNSSPPVPTRSAGTAPPSSASAGADTVAIAGDGQVTLGQTVVKGNASKVRRLAGGQVLAGSPAPPPTPSPCSSGSRPSSSSLPSQLTRACVELAKDWRTDRYLRRLEAMMVVADARPILSRDRHRRRAGAGGRRRRHRLGRQLRAGRGPGADRHARPRRRGHRPQARWRSPPTSASTPTTDHRRDDRKTPDGRPDLLSRARSSPNSTASSSASTRPSAPWPSRCATAGAASSCRTTLRDEVTPKNILMIGPTGVGKTEIARRLARWPRRRSSRSRPPSSPRSAMSAATSTSIVRDLVEIAIDHGARRRAQRRAGQGRGRRRGAHPRRPGRRARRRPTRAEASARSCAPASWTTRRSSSQLADAGAARSASSTSPASRRRQMGTGRI